MPVLNSIAALHDEMTAWRRDLHANPEVGFEVTRTAGFVAERLRAWGVEVHEGVGGTGVVGVLRGRGPGGSVGLRADMDALPMTEETGLPHASTRAGRMHGCGHDGHTAMLLGAARHLAETRNFDGTVHLFFQPAEEIGAGAKAMMDDGLFARFPVDSVWGIHNAPPIPLGQASVRPGAAMAAVDFFDVVVEGKGGHAARPQTTVDPIAVATQVHQAFQTIVSRNADPVESAVVSVTKLQGGEAHNVIPARVVLGGTVRTFAPAVRDMVERRMREICAGLGAANGAAITVDYRRLTPSLHNGAAEAAFAAEVAAEVLGPGAVDVDPPPIMGGEDFAYMLEARPGCFLFLGQGDADHVHQVHHPLYDFNDAILPLGASLFVRLAEKALPRSA